MKSAADDVQHIADNIAQLLDSVTTTTKYTRHHGPGADGVHRRRPEVAVHRTHHRGLLHQLLANLTPGSPGGQEGGRRKPGSRPPVTAAISNTLQEIEEEAQHRRMRMRYVTARPEKPAGTLTATLLEVRALAHAVGESERQATAKATARWVHLARVALAYDAPPAQLRDVVCPDCQYALWVPSDASGHVWCPNPACRDERGRRRRWEREEWPFLLERLQGGDAA